MAANQDHEHDEATTAQFDAELAYCGQPVSCEQLTHIQRCASQLQVLRLNNANLPRIQPEWLGSLRALRSLCLSGNGIAQLPPEVGALGCLEHILLDNNELTALPAALAECTALKVLQASCNALGELRMDALPHSLRTVQLSRNRIRRVHWAHLPACEALDLSHNQVAQLTLDATLLPALRKLTLAHNDVRGLVLPPGGHPVLQVMNLAGNKLPLLPAGIAACTSLQVLRVDWNALEALPPGMETMARLRSLGLVGNPMKAPPHDIACQDVKTVLGWCKGQRSALTRRLLRDMVQLTQRALAEVDAAGLAVPGLFQSNVPWARGHGTVTPAFAFDEGYLFDELVPELQSAHGHPALAALATQPQDDVLRALSSFRDAAGNISQAGVATQLRHCACVDEAGRRHVCIPGFGYKCKRPMRMLSMRILTAADLTNLNAETYHEMAVKSATQQAERRIRARFASEEGRGELEAAISRQLLDDHECVRRLKYETRCTSSVAAQMHKTQLQYDQRRRRVIERKARMEVQAKIRLRQFKHEIARTQVPQTMGRLLERIEDEEEELSKLQARTKEQLAALSALESRDMTKLQSALDKALAAYRSMSALEQQQLLLVESTQARLRAEKFLLVEAKVREAAKQERIKMEQQRERLLDVCFRWRNLTVAPCVKRWKSWAVERKQLRCKLSAKMAAAEHQIQECKRVLPVVLQRESHYWRKCWDEFEQRHFYWDSHTGEATWDDPTLDIYAAYRSAHHGGLAPGSPSNAK